MSRTPVALVTGSTGGIGSQVAQALAARGYRLILQDLDRSRLEQQATMYEGARIEVNLVSTAVLVQALARRMRAAGSGHLIATVSMGGIVSLKGSAPYSASKFGLRGLLWGLRDELQPHGVHVCGICPAGVDTAMLRHEARHGGSALNFVGQPVSVDTVARAVLRAIDQPRLETDVPASEGITGRMAGAFPGMLARLYPLLEKLGERGRAAYLARIEGQTR